MKKASIPIYVALIILLIAFFLLATVTIVMTTISTQKCIGLKSTCANARIKFCQDWYDLCSDFSCSPTGVKWDDSIKTCETEEKGNVEKPCPKPSVTECKTLEV